MTDYVWLEHPTLPGQTVRVERQSLLHYIPNGWVETDPVPELTAADIEAAEAEVAVTHPDGEDEDELRPAKSVPLDEADDDTI